MLQSYIEGSAYLPVLQYKFVIRSEKLPTIKIYGKSTGLPKIQNELIEIPTMGGRFKMAGIPDYSSISMDLYTFEGITQEEIIEWVNQHYNPTLFSTGFPDSYKSDMYIYVLDSNHVPLKKFTLIGAFLESVDFGSLDWSTSDMVVANISVAYDYLQID